MTSMTLSRIPAPAGEFLFRASGAADQVTAVVHAFGGRYAVSLRDDESGEWVCSPGHSAPLFDEVLPAEVYALHVTGVARLANGREVEARLFAASAWTPEAVELLIEIRGFERYMPMPEARA